MFGLEKKGQALIPAIAIMAAVLLTAATMQTSNASIESRETIGLKAGSQPRESQEIAIAPESKAAEISIIDLYSSPQTGELWEVRFTTKGKTDLMIIPNDQATIEDDEFVSLSCGEEERQAQILENDVIFYPNWECEETGKVTHYTLKAGKHTLRFEFGNQVDYAYNGPWLSGWNKRVKLTIDSGDIDSDLSNFPILAYLSASSGINLEDITFVFDELGANSKKIAVTKSDGTTECYVEIEKWDNSAEQAWLWVNVSGENSISSSADTNLYLYYDNTHADNTDYVGLSDSVAAENVWDSNYRFVGHMEDGADTSHIYDSTTNDNDGTKASVANPPVTTSGQIGNAQYFNGSSDYISLLENGTLDLDSAITMEVWVRFDGVGSTLMPLIQKRSGSSSNYGMRKGMAGQTWSSGADELDVENYGSTWCIWGSDNADFAATTWYNITVTYDETTHIIYKNGATVTSSKTYGTCPQALTVNNTAVTLGAYTNENNWLDGILDEVRISSSVRSAAWIKASYESERDNLLDFGEEETNNAVPDCNIWQVDGWDLNAALPSFAYYADENLAITFRTSDADSDDLNFNMWYDTTANGKSNKIIGDINLSTDASQGACDTNSKTGMVCTWDWNIFEIADNNYWVTIEINDGTDTNTISSERSFRVNPAAADLTFAIFLPVSGCTEGKGSYAGNTSGTCDKCFFENTGLYDQNHVGCQGQVDEATGPSFFFFDNQSTSSTSLDWEMDLNAALPETMKLKVSQAHTGWEAICSADPTSGCVDVNAASKALVGTSIAVAVDLNAWAWADFIGVSAGSIDRNATHYSTGS